MVFSDTTNNLGIVQQVRSMLRVDSNQWPTYKIVNSCNNWLDTVSGYAIGADRRFQWDDSNHTKLPEATTALTSGQSDYSFLTDEQGNSIITLLGISVLSNGYYVPLEVVDRNDPSVDVSTFGQTTGTPTRYDKIADNIIRLDFKPSATVSSGLKFYFQRSPSYFAATDTTKAPGFAPMLHRGFVIASVFDGIITLKPSELSPWSIERETELQKMIQYFGRRDNDEVRRVVVASHSNK